MLNRTFDDPFTQVQAQDVYKGREVGITHPDVPSFIRLSNNGDIEIVAGEGLSIILNPRSRSMTFVADHIKFVTKEENGMRWNRLTFNNKATSFAQPAFLTIDPEHDYATLYSGTEYFSEEDEEPVFKPDEFIRSFIQRTG